MFFVWRCARARMPLLTGFWAAITVGRAQTASSMVPSVDLILDSPVKGVLAARILHPKGSAVQTRLGHAPPPQLCRPARRRRSHRRAVERGAGGERRLQPVPRLRPGASTYRGPELRLGLDLARRPRDDHAGGAPPRAGLRGPRCEIGRAHV